MNPKSAIDDSAHGTVNTMRALDIVAMAVAEERERCAKLAQEVDIRLCAYPSPEAQEYFEAGTIDAGSAIASHIRDGLEPGHVREIEVIDKLSGLRKGIQAFIDGDYPNPRQHRPGKCGHGIYYYDDCGQCNDEYFVKLLSANAE